jgi:hypothetical protein
MAFLPAVCSAWTAQKPVDPLIAIKVLRPFSYE